MGLRDIGAALPPGFRFYPSDEELVCHYLYKKIANEDVLKGTDLLEIDLHTCEPWQLPEVAKLNSTEWYFFSFRDRKYATGFRTNRATKTGYWKATGKDRTVVDPRTNAIVGMRKTLVFYKNRAPNGIKTGWIMHEFRLENPLLPPKEDWVLCRVFHKAKTENNNSEVLSPQNYVFDAKVTTGGDKACPPAAQILPHHQITSNLSQNHQNQNPNTNNNQEPLLSPLINPNFLQLSHQAHTDISLARVNEDEYGFLFDMSFEESNLGMDSHIYGGSEISKFGNNGFK